MDEKQINCPVNGCPCEAVDKLGWIVEQQAKQLEEHEEWLKRHDDRLGKGNEDFAVINTKLSVLIGVLSAVGVALAGVIANMLF